MVLKFKLIAAASDNMGIGFKGDLPWRLKNEMAYFTRMTTKTINKDKKNAVIMGRLTWQSIPPKYQPLRGRLNVIISKKLTEAKGDAVIFSTLNDALNTLNKSPYCDKIENFWIIGGASVYKEAILSEYCDKIYLTKIYKTFECDTFFPEIPSVFSEITEDDVPKGIQEENGINYEFKVYQRNKENN